MGLTRPRAHQLQDLDYKQAVRVITTTNVTLSGGAPNEVDGVSLSLGDRILVAGQTDGAENGIYQVTTVGAGSSGTWARTATADEDGEINAGMIVMVTEGTVNADVQWKLITDDPIVVGTTELEFTQASADAFGIINADGTNIIADSVGDTVTLSPGNNISITGNAASDTITIGVTGIALDSISNGTSNVSVVSSGGNITVGIGGSEVAEFSSSLLTVTGNVSGSNITTGGVVDATGNVSGGNITTAGDVTTATVTASGAISSETTITATGNISGGNITTGGVVDATGNVSGGNITTAGDLSVSGLSTLSGNVRIQGQNQLQFFDSDSSHYVSFKSANTVSANVNWTLPNADGSNGQVLSTNGTGDLVWITVGGGGGGDITWTTVANVPPVSPGPGDFWYDSFSQIKYQYINDGTSNVWVDQTPPTTFSSLSTGQIINASANGVGNIGTSGGRFDSVFAGFFVGDGSQLTGLPAGYTDDDVASFLSSFGSNTISTTGSISASSFGKTGSNGIGNIGSSLNTFNTVFAKATSAQYADLAEMYTSDCNYEPGTVVVFGGDQEITQSIKSHDTRVAGVVSTNPAFVMNSTINNKLDLPVAFTGRVPCWVQGPVDKGDVLVTGEQTGTAQRINSWKPGCVVGKSLDRIDNNEIKKIEVVVGRF